MNKLTALVILVILLPRNSVSLSVVTEQYESGRQQQIWMGFQCKFLLQYHFCRLFDSITLHRFTSNGSKKHSSIYLSIYSAFRANKNQLIRLTESGHPFTAHPCTAPRMLVIAFVCSAVARIQTSYAFCRPSV